MSEVMLRHWKTLQLVPRHPQRATARQICERLAAAGHPTSERTVQRDLEKLSAAFMLACDQRSKPYGWHWAKDAKLLNIPNMDLPTALTFRFVREYVDPLLPKSVRGDLAAHFEAAARVLDTCAENSLPGWAEKIVVIPQGQALTPPAVDADAMDAVFEALLTNRVLEMRYLARSREGEVKDYTVHPLGLVVRNGAYYLVATLFDYDNPVQLALHRIERAAVTDGTAKRPDGFSLKHYVRDGNFAYPVGDEIALAIRMRQATAFHLYESPLAADQAIEPLGEDTVRITATVKDTQQLRWWLLGFGDHVVVEGPAALREEFAATCRRMAELYTPD